MNQKSSIGRTLVALSIVTAAMLASASAVAATYSVNTIADSGPGSLRDAITQANANTGADTINFDPALTASGPATVSLASALPTVTEVVTIAGPGASKLTIRNGLADQNDPGGNEAAMFRVFTIAVDAPGVVTISGLTVSNGAAGFPGGGTDPAGFGGGIMNGGTGTLNVTDSTIANNHAGFAGGGIANGGAGILNVTRCTINSNTVGSVGGGLSNLAVGQNPGGAMHIASSVISGNQSKNQAGGIVSSQSVLSLVDSTVDNNAARATGGIYASGTVSIARSTISNNQTVNDLAGGLLLSSATADITESTISGNTAAGFSGGYFATAGGIQVYYSALNLANCTLANNHMLGAGGVLGAGAISVFSPDGQPVNIKNCTISGNSSLSGPGGIVKAGSSTYPGTIVNVRGSIVAGNSSVTPSTPSEAAFISAITSQGYNVIGDNELSPITPVVGDQTGVTPAQLNISALADNGGPTKTMALLPGSVAIDKGSANGLTTDQRGYGRIFDTGTPNAVDGTDVGAFEAQSLTFVVTTTADSGPGSLRDAITQSNENPDADKITFAIPTSDPGYDAASGHWTISLMSALPVITDSVTITGSGKDRLTVKNGLVDPHDPFGILVDPNNSTFNSATCFRVFTVAVDAPGVVSVSGLAIKYGFAFLVAADGTTKDNFGGGILNAGTGTLNVTDSAITNNIAQDGGGGIANYQTGTLNVTRCTISDNGKAPQWNGTPDGILEAFTGPGGGISNGGDYVFGQNILTPGGTVRVADSVISGNGGTGGGIGAPAGGAIIVTNSTISGNESTYGAGGIHAFGGTVSILNSTISGNQSKQTKCAGGLKFDHSTADITNSTITGNIGDMAGNSAASVAAGGIYSIVSTVTVTNCTLTNNQATSSSYGDPAGPYGVSSGAITNDIASNGSGGTLNIFNCTISDNSNDNGPGGILNRGQPESGAVGVVNIRSSIVAGNISSPLHYPPTGGRVFPINSLGYNVIGDNEIMPVTSFTGDQAGVTVAQLNLGPLANNGGATLTMALGLGSVAINHGFADPSVLPNDQRGVGFARVIGAAADVGAFEVQNHAPVAKAQNISVPAGSNCQASVTPQQVNNGSSDPDAGDTLTLSLDQSGPFAIGNHNVTLTARDSLGYSSTATAVVTVVDAAPPVITAPAPSSATANNQGKAAVPNVLAKTTTSDCSVVTLQQSPAAGTLVGIGAQTITITATDSANNKSTATTKFTVTAGPPSVTISVNPSTVKQGGIVTFTLAYSNYATTSQSLTLKISLTEPKSKTLMLTVPLTLKAGQVGSVSFPLPIAKATKVGSYSLTLDEFVGATQVGTSTAQLTVTK
jgi:hypothetical protein